MSQQKGIMPIRYDSVKFDIELPDDEHFVIDVKPNIAKTCHLCEYDIEFSKSKNPKTGQMEYPIYTLDSREFPPKHLGGSKSAFKGKSVLPEILKKLMSGFSPVVNLHGSVKIIKEEKKAKSKE